MINFFCKTLFKGMFEFNKFESASNAYAFLGTINLENLNLSKEYFDKSFSLSKKPTLKFK